MNEQILERLKAPFLPTFIEWKPGATTKDGSKAMGMAYADLRAYMTRLDEICGMGWSVTYTPWGDRLLCHITINGVTRSSVGEADSQSEKSEIAGTAAEAQAFKRACAMFGLGRYLYELPAIWAEYDKDRRSFTDQGRAKLEVAVATHYRQWRDAQDKPAGQTHEESAREFAQLLIQFNELGKLVYNGQWEDTVRAHNTDRITNGQTKDYTQLTADQVKRMMVGMQSLLRKRQEAIDLAAEPGQHDEAPATEENPFNGPPTPPLAPGKPKGTNKGNGWPGDSAGVQALLTTLSAVRFHDDTRQLIATMTAAHVAGKAKNWRIKTTNKDGSGKGQYGVLAYKLDDRYKAYGKNMHVTVLSVLCGEPISTDNTPGMTKEGGVYIGAQQVIDWIGDPDQYAQPIAMLDEIAAAIHKATGK